MLGTGERSYFFSSQNSKYMRCRTVDSALLQENMISVSICTMETENMELDIIFLEKKLMFLDIC